MPDAPEPPVRDPLVAAALHDLKGALAAQALLVSSLERDVRSPARLDHMAGTIGSLRETVEHASELARLLTLASLPPASTMAVGMAELVRLALAALHLPANLNDTKFLLFQMFRGQRLTTVATSRLALDLLEAAQALLLLG